MKRQKEKKHGFAIERLVFYLRNCGTTLRELNKYKHTAIFSGISDFQTKIRDQILTESIRLQFRDFIAIILVFPLIYMYRTFNSMVKGQ